MKNIAFTNFFNQTQLAKTSNNFNYSVSQLVSQCINYHQFKAEAWKTNFKSKFVKSNTCYLMVSAAASNQGLLINNKTSNQGDVRQTVWKVNAWSIFSAIFINKLTSEAVFHWFCFQNCIFLNVEKLTYNNGRMQSIGLY